MTNSAVPPKRGRRRRGQETSDECCTCPCQRDKDEGQRKARAGGESPQAPRAAGGGGDWVPHGEVPTGKRVSIAGGGGGGDRRSLNHRNVHTCPNTPPRMCVPVCWGWSATRTCEHSSMTSSTTEVLDFMQTRPAGEREREGHREMPGWGPRPARAPRQLQCINT